MLLWSWATVDITHSCAKPKWTRSSHTSAASKQDSDCFCAKSKHSLTRVDLCQFYTDSKLDFVPSCLEVWCTCTLQKIHRGLRPLFHRIGLVLCKTLGVQNSFLHWIRSLLRPLAWIQAVHKSEFQFLLKNTLFILFHILYKYFIIYNGIHKNVRLWHAHSSCQLNF
jgi:hypothetical protein